MKLRVVTFNIHGARPARGRANVAAVAEVLRALDPDLCALQEVHCWLPPPGVFADQPRTLARKLDRHATYLPSFGLHPAGFGNLLLSRQAPAAAHRHRLPSRREPRVLVEARFVRAGCVFRVGVVHLGLDPAERCAQVKRIVKLRPDPGEPTVLLGDWNAEPEAPELRLLHAAGYRSAAPVPLATFPSDAPVRRIDQILVSRHWRVDDCRTVPSRVSDHLPLLAELRYVG